jgi:hypothetical protein
MFTLDSEAFLHSDDPLVFAHCDVHLRQPYLNNPGGLLQVLGTCTGHFLVLLHTRYHVRLSEWRC